MESRRTFLKKASLLAGATAAVNGLPQSIQRALAIQAPAGSTYLDAEHIVFLMQENRSFDHCFGTLRGVRGFQDPRAKKLPNGMPVWVQANHQGLHYVPFHLDIVHSKSTWMGSLPHGWRDMVAARNSGKMDNWLEAKSSGVSAYKDMPLTMGYYNRADLPFYYAFADAFTVCDQHFCSSLTGTSANRSYFWSGTIREQPHDPNSTPHVDNGQINYRNVSWKTYPERLQEAGISWKVYQNELSVPVGFYGEKEDWLANFTDNNLEFHRQYGVRYHPAHYQWMQKRVQALPEQINSTQDQDERSKLQQQLVRLTLDLETFSPENFARLSPQEQAIHKHAFVTNTDDPQYHELETISYQDQEGLKKVQVPAGDVFHQFRQDALQQKLPQVSWLVAPCRFSDHPGSPWYGAWYVSEALDILTQDPELWKKTIFILTYDENDGYFDHVSPFVPVGSSQQDGGKMSASLRSDQEYVTVEQERKRTGKEDASLESPIGLGFRVPMVVASPWSAGGWVNSQVMDLTSNLQFLEHFLHHKTGKNIVETNISPWRRAVCGDLTSVFRPAPKTQPTYPTAVNRNDYVARIFSAKAKGLPADYQSLEATDIAAIQRDGYQQHVQPIQEAGIKNACALPYMMDVNGSCDLGQFSIDFEVFAPLRSAQGQSLAVPFQVMALMGYGDTAAAGRVWDFTVLQQDKLSYSWDMQQVHADVIQLELHGPNGFYRSFQSAKEQRHQLQLRQVRRAGLLKLELTAEDHEFTYRVVDRAYRSFKPFQLKGSQQRKHTIDCSKSFGWYDLEVTCLQDPTFKYIYAGHLEHGMPSKTDPLMGQALTS